MYVKCIYNVSAYTQYANSIYNECVNDGLVTYMSDTPAKRQAYSFAFPPDKKQAFTKIADEKYQRPASWLLLAAIDQVIANGGLLEELSPAPKAPVNDDSTQWDELKAEVKYLRECLDSTATKDYVEKSLQSVQVAIDAVRNNLDDQGADVADLRAQLAELKTTTPSAPAKATTTKKTPAKPKGV
jgi:hypothetical protein